MKKELRKLGTQIGITFTSQELRIYDMKEGDVLDLSEMVVIGPRNYPSHNVEDKNEN